ncbi:MAG: hypothetical protein FJW39_29195 [Acidobacteria bacterium]|nr:hypothetical protein [Acidobacteriota bacterium]
MRIEAKKLLLDPRQALAGREEHVISADALVEPALDQVLQNLEFWMDGDLDRLRFFLVGQVDTARNGILTSEAGMAALSRQIAHRFANPEIVRDGTAIGADFGLLPVPLEKNIQAKGYSLRVRHREDTSKGWIERDRPTLSVIARAALDLLAKHPEASMLVLRFVVLRRMGQPVFWEFTAVRPAHGSGLTISGKGRAPGFDESVAPYTGTVEELNHLASAAPGPS